MSNHLDAPESVLESLLHTVTVLPQKLSRIDLRLSVGSSIAGRVYWKDGTPARANAVQVAYVGHEGVRRHYHPFAWEELAWQGQEPKFLADSNGAFRVDGLYKGAYLLGAAVPEWILYPRKNTDSRIDRETINCFSSFYWAGSTPNLMEASPIAIGTGEHISGVEIHLPTLPKAP